MLTLEQVQELRRLAEEGKASRQIFEERFLGSWSELLDAAESVARDAAWMEGLVEDDRKFARAQMGRDEVSRRKAEALAAELEAECLAEFKWRPLVARDSYEATCNPHAFAPQHIEAWYAARGVVVRVEPDEANVGHLRITPIRLR